MDISNKVILNQGHSFWDQTLLLELVKDLPETERKLFIVPGTINTIEEVNYAINGFSKVLVVISSDEENKFPINQLNHQDMIVYVMYVNKEKHSQVNRYLPIGYPPDTKLLKESVKNLDWFFAGQINHDSRKQLIDILRPLDGKLLGTDGFSQGFPHEEYYDYMSRAKIVPCPGGPFSPDSFRLYEALEAGVIPIPDHPEFWSMLFPNHPFPTLDNWDKLPDLINNLKDRPEMNNKCFAWWQWQKRQMRINLEDDLGIGPKDMTVLIPTSPIPSHPDTRIIEETIISIRERTDSEIIIMIDGVRDEQKGYYHNYNEYIRRLLWKCNHEWNNVYPLLFEDHQHQANMAREALRHVRTKTILYVEHDTPLTGEIPFPEMVGAIDTGEVNLIRFHYEAAVHPEHYYLMLDVEPKLINNVPLLRCAQWSQRPHLASTKFYREIIDQYFPLVASTMIEDLMYGVLYNAFVTRGTAGWNDFRVWMYAPEGDIKRSLNLDGRESDPKYEMRFS